MSKELDIAVARAMGFRVVKDSQNVRGCQVGTAGRKGHDLPYYSEDAALIPVLLVEVERRLRKPEYILALLTQIGSSAEHADRDLWYVSFNDFWTLITATPEQHCRAFIACTQAP